MVAVENERSPRSPNGKSAAINFFWFKTWAWAQERLASKSVLNLCSLIPR